MADEQSNARPYGRASLVVRGAQEGVAFRAPRYASMPHVLVMLDSIGSDVAVARFLGLSLRTIKKYRREGQAPRAVMYALFWETPWGLSLADSVAVNDARMAYARAIVAEREAQRLRAQVAALEAELDCGQVAANQMFFKVGL